MTSIVHSSIRNTSYEYREHNHIKDMKISPFRLRDLTIKYITTNDYGKMIKKIDKFTFLDFILEDMIMQ